MYHNVNSTLGIGINGNQVQDALSLGVGAAYAPDKDTALRCKVRKGLYSRINQVPNAADLTRTFSLADRVQRKYLGALFGQGSPLGELIPRDSHL